MNNKYAKIFAVVGFIVGGIWAAQNNPHFIGIYDVTSFAGFIGGAIPLCLIASVLGYVIDKFAIKDSQLNDQSKTSESLDIETKQNWVSDDLYKQALNELEGGDMQAGLWAKCFADADGLENVAKAQYINSAITHFEQSVSIVTPLATDKELAAFKSRFARVASKGDYESLMSEITHVGERGGIKVPDFKAW